MRKKLKKATFYQKMEKMHRKDDGVTCAEICLVISYIRRLDVFFMKRGALQCEEHIWWMENAGFAAE